MSLWSDAEPYLKMLGLHEREDTKGLSYWLNLPDHNQINVWCGDWGKAIHVEARSTAPISGCAISELETTNLEHALHRIRKLIKRYNK